MRTATGRPHSGARPRWHLYAGWHDGNPAHLKPALDRDLALELAGLAGGADALATRARTRAQSGDLRTAAHLVEFAVTADPQSKAIHAARAEIYGKIASAEPSLIGKALFSVPLRESARAD